MRILVNSKIPFKDIPDDGNTVFKLESSSPESFRLLLKRHDGYIILCCDFNFYQEKCNAIPSDNELRSRHIYKNIPPSTYVVVFDFLDKMRKEKPNNHKIRKIIPLHPLQ